jgi:hypothetical protein
MNAQKAAMQKRSNTAKVVVATTAMLTIISFWRAAAIVLNDLGSSAFYAGAIVEQAIGKSAPWFILAIMVFSYAVCGLYIESCSMFVRGGVYRVVKEAMGSTLAKSSISALMFDYILTGPISGVSAGQYLVGYLNDFLKSAHSSVVLPVNFTSAAFAILVTIYFWWENIKGIPRSRFGISLLAPVFVRHRKAVTRRHPVDHRLYGNAVVPSVLSGSHQPRRAGPASAMRCEHPQPYLQYHR